MTLFRSRADGGTRTDLIAEIERLVKRVLVVPVAAPLLLLAGLGLGRITTRALALPAGTPVRASARVAPLHIDRLDGYMAEVRNEGRETASFVALYRNQVAPVERSLRRRGVRRDLARRLAWPIVENASRTGIDPATIVAVMLVESDARPHATSSVGARGLMQIMPVHRGRWRGCGVDLYDIDDNLCNGTSILAWYLQHYDNDFRRALLGYNGCVHGTNTPNCRQYPEVVARERRRLLREWDRGSAGAAAPMGVAAP